MRFGGLIAAIVFAAIMAVIVLRMSGGNNAPQPAVAAAPPVRTEQIYVATQTIPIGATIQENMVTAQAWPQHLMLSGFMRVNPQAGVIGGGNNAPESPIGMIARAPFQAQEPILSSKVANAQDPNFLAGALPRGMRVITIQTNEIEGIAGFVFPGDRIDILLTHDVDKWITEPTVTGQTGLRRVNEAVTETLLTNVSVLAVDQRTSGGNAVNDKGQLIIPQSVSLMVSPTDAQRLRLGAREGTLTLALRSIEDRESSDPLILTSFKDISQYPEAGSTFLDDTSGTITADRVLVVRGTTADEPASGAAAMPPAARRPASPNIATAPR